MYERYFISDRTKRIIALEILEGDFELTLAVGRRLREIGSLFIRFAPTWKVDTGSRVLMLDFLEVCYSVGLLLKEDKSFWDRFLDLDFWDGHKVDPSNQDVMAAVVIYSMNLTTLSDHPFAAPISQILENSSEEYLSFDDVVAQVELLLTTVAVKS